MAITSAAILGRRKIIHICNNFLLLTIARVHLCNHYHKLLKLKELVSVYTQSELREKKSFKKKFSLQLILIPSETSIIFQNEIKAYGSLHSMSVCPVS